MTPPETPSSYSLNPSLHYYSQGAPSAPGLYQPYSYYGYPPPQMSPWGYTSGPNPHHTAASLSQNANNLVDTASLQFWNTFTPPEIPSRAPLAPLSLSQPSVVPTSSSTSWNELPRQADQLPSALNDQILRMPSLEHPPLMPTYLLLQLVHYSSCQSSYIPASCLYSLHLDSSKGPEKYQGHLRCLVFHEELANEAKT